MLNEQKPTKETVVAGLDSVVIRKCLHDIQGGRTLDCKGFTGTVVKAGHVIIKKSDGNYAPMPCHEATPAKGETAAVEAGYDALPGGASYVGINKTTIATDCPTAAIMTMGAVNSALLPYPMDSILAAFKTACPHINFEKDEEA